MKFNQQPEQLPPCLKIYGYIVFRKLLFKQKLICRLEFFENFLMKSKIRGYYNHLKYRVFVHKR